MGECRRARTERGRSRRAGKVLWTVAVTVACLAAGGCGGGTRREAPAQRGAVAPAQGGAVRVIAAGDIACTTTDPAYNRGRGTPGRCAQTRTAKLVVHARPDLVLALGDNQYEFGTLDKYQASFNPTWGRLKPLIRPVPGNHDYSTKDAAGYFDYFNGVGKANGLAGPRGKGYYSFDVGGWHLIALNSECRKIGGCEVGSPQDRWLRADLAASTADCTLAYWHHPRFSSGDHGSSARHAPLWQALMDGHADVVLTGHDHLYERFARQDANGVRDPQRGIREFVVGTGGKNHRAVRHRAPNSEVVRADTFGVLALTLRPGAYDWRFIPEAGRKFTDSGTDRCD